MAPSVEDIVRIAVATLSILVFIVGMVAFARRPTVRMMLVAALFTVFLVQGLLLLYELFIADSTVARTAYFAFQLVEVALVAAIILKR